MERHDFSAGETGSQVMGAGPVVFRSRVVQIVALVKPFRAQAVLAALEGVELLGGTVREAPATGGRKTGSISI